MRMLLFPDGEVGYIPLYVDERRAKVLLRGDVVSIACEHAGRSAQLLVCETSHGPFNPRATAISGEYPGRMVFGNAILLTEGDVWDEAHKDEARQGL